MSEITDAPKQASPEVVEAPARTGASMISLRGVSKFYIADKAALADCNVEIKAGEFVFIVGHSGSGKSTFIRLLLRELLPSRGQIIVAGQDLVKLKNWKVPTCGATSAVSSRTSSCCPTRPRSRTSRSLSRSSASRSTSSALRFPRCCGSWVSRTRSSSYPDELSGGEQQRVSIARAFVNRPPLLLCDEPTGNLDPQTSLGIMKLLERINKTGTTVLVATHDRDMVDNMRRRVIALEGGRVIRDQDRGVYGYVD